MNRSSGVTTAGKAQCLAFYLPQYHPIAENDLWWGAGFTEWRNVTAAKPQFRGHYQPHVPGELGYYDLRVPEVRAKQVALAVEAGLDGFVYYHYWFNGRRLLERPFTEVLETKEPNFPFCLAWANENWTRRWDGMNNDILMAQEYSPVDDLDHIRSLRSALTDDRYLKRCGKPMLLVYRSSKLPNPVATTDLWRAEVQRWGLPDLYLLRVEGPRSEVGDPREVGFDGAVQFQPDWKSMNIPVPPMGFRVRRRLKYFTDRYSHRVVHYDDLIELARTGLTREYRLWPGVTPGFDNSARRKRDATIVVGSSPERYEGWLRYALECSSLVAGDVADGGGGLVFINAWNEWAEGNHLEPDARYGKGFIKATRSAMDRYRSSWAPDDRERVHVA